MIDLQLIMFLQFLYNLHTEKPKMKINHIKIQVNITVLCFLGQALGKRYWVFLLRSDHRNFWHSQ